MVWRVGDASGLVVPGLFAGTVRPWAKDQPRLRELPRR